MELVVSKADLLRELQLFQGIVERKNTIPILANVLICAEEDHLSLLATDLEVGLRSRCAASITTPGTITIPAKKLFEIVRSLPETDIRIESDEGAVKVVESVLLLLGLIGWTACFVKAAYRLRDKSLQQR